MKTTITFRQLDTLSIDDLQRLANIQYNPFKDSDELREYLRKATNEYFKKLCNLNKD